MRSSNLNVFLRLAGLAVGAGFGLALAASPAALAGPIDDAWPYGATGAVSLPGHPGPHSFPATGGYDVTYVHDPYFTQNPPPGDEWYTIHQTTTSIPILGSFTHTEVTSLIDTTDPIPHVGTVVDDMGLFPVPVLGGVVGAPMIANHSLDDPELGTASVYNLFFGLFENSYLSDSAGVKDVVGVFGVPITLFEIPAADASAGGAADASGELLTEFTHMFPDVSTLF